MLPTAEVYCEHQRNGAVQVGQDEVQDLRHDSPGHGSLWCLTVAQATEELSNKDAWDFTFPEGTSGVMNTSPFYPQLQSSGDIVWGPAWCWVPLWSSNPNSQLDRTRPVHRQGRLAGLWFACPGLPVGGVTGHLLPSSPWRSLTSSQMGANDETPAALTTDFPRKMSKEGFQ